VRVIRCEWFAILEDAPDATIIAVRLQAPFCPIAPTLQVYPLVTPPSSLPLTRASVNAGITMWVHRGAGDTIINLVGDAAIPLLRELYLRANP
jgi:hypothetical protein